MGAMKSFQNLLLSHGSIDIIENQKAELPKAEISLQKKDTFCSAWKNHLIQKKQDFEAGFFFFFWQTNPYFCMQVLSFARF